MIAAAYVLAPIFGALTGFGFVQAFGVRKGLPLGIVAFLGSYGVGVIAGAS